MADIFHTSCFCGHRHLQILYPPLHWIHAELAELPAGLRRRHGERNRKPHLPGDGVPPPPSRVPPASQRHPRQARWVCHPLRDRRQVHVRRPTVSSTTSVSATVPICYHLSASGESWICSECTVPLGKKWQWCVDARRPLSLKLEFCQFKWR